MPILTEHKEILSSQSESKTLPEWVEFFDSQYTKSQIYSYCYHNGYKIKKLSKEEKSKIQSANSRKYRINQDYFKTWSHNMAYILGLWYADGVDFDGINVTDKNKFRWISMIRQPEFVTEDVFEQAKISLKKKKPDLDLGKARLMKMTEGLCVQIMHKGSYDDEPATIKTLKDFVNANGYAEDFSEGRFHHEIYLSDPRKCAPEKLKTVIRHPVKKIEA